MAHQWGYRNVKVYAADRITVLAEVSERVTSIGAARAAKVDACTWEQVEGRMAWVAVEREGSAAR